MMVTKEQLAKTLKAGDFESSTWELPSSYKKLVLVVDYVMAVLAGRDEPKAALMCSNFFVVNESASQAIFDRFRSLVAPMANITGEEVGIDLSSLSYDDSYSLTLLAVVGGWDVELLLADVPLVVERSHDGFIKLSGNTEKVAEIGNGYKKLGLKKVQ